jgi:hypothetical protein
MSKAAISIFVFGLYILINAITLMAAPNLLLGILGLEPTREPWLRVFGAVIFVLGLYYLQAARQEVTPFFRWTTWGRPLLLLVFIVLVALKLIPPIMIVFGVVDLAGAVWTAASLRHVGA